MKPWRMRLPERMPGQFRRVRGVRAVRQQGDLPRLLALRRRYCITPGPGREELGEDWHRDAGNEQRRLAKDFSSVNMSLDQATNAMAVR